MIKLKVKIISFFAIVFLSVGFFATAQTLNTNPTIEVCVGGICYPEVGSVKIAVDSDGLIPGNLTYKRGSLVRIHAEIKDSGGLKYAKAVIRNAAGSDLAIIPLYNDGNKLHGDEAGAPNGSPDGVSDDVFSGLWSVPYSLNVATPYYLHIEAADNFANVYKSDTDSDYNSDSYEIEFFLTDTCLSVCPNVGEERCGGGGIIQECLFDAAEGCNAWQPSSSCASGVCCGTDPNVFCCGAGQSCSTVNTCINCDHACNGACANALCSGADDPDCSGAGCCGDHTCNPSETPATCPGDCPDITGPNVTLSPSTLASVDEGLILVFMAAIADDYYGIATDPMITVKNSLGNPVGVTYLFDNGVDGGDINAGDGTFTGLINTFNLSLSPGTYTIDATAQDTSPNFNTTIVNNIHAFTVNCVNECNPFVFPGDCDASDNLLGCSLGGDGCYDIAVNDNCPSLGGQVCRFNTGSSSFNCCQENCDPSTYIPTCDLTGQYLQACVTQADGCDREQSNIDCQVQTGSPNGACGVSPVTGNASCCVNVCALGQSRCNNTLNIVENCGIDQASGCNAWLPGNDCTASAATCHIGTGGANCCANACPAVGTDLFCDAPGLWTQNCVYNAATDCNERPNNTNCALTPGQVCRINSSNTSNCCQENCDPASYTPACDATARYLQSCVTQSDGCDREVTNIDCQANFPNGACKTAPLSGQAGCCVNECTLGDTKCNAAGIAVETCVIDNNSGCASWQTLSGNDCGSQGKVCKTGLIGANCCAEECAVLGLNLFCRSDNLWTQNCANDSATGCNVKMDNKDCAALVGAGGECRQNNLTGQKDCCKDDCALPYTASCSGNNLTDCVLNNNDNCYDITTSSCDTGLGEVCKINASGEGNCCVNECNIGDPLECNGSVLESCQAQATGCNARVGGTNCADTGKACYDGATPSDNAYCDILDTTPPVVTLLSPVPSSASWTQDAQADFESAGHSISNTSTSLNPGSISLKKTYIGGSSWKQTDHGTGESGFNKSGSVFNDTVVYSSGVGASVKLAPQDIGWIDGAFNDNCIILSTGGTIENIDGINVRTFKFTSFYLNGTCYITSPEPLQITVRDNVTITATGVLSAAGSGANGYAGGGNGGVWTGTTESLNGTGWLTGPSSASATDNNGQSGSGGGYGGNGGNGINVNDGCALSVPGTAYSGLAMYGGSGGSGGRDYGDDYHANGGGGGGAIHIRSMSGIVLDGIINVDGGSGQSSGGYTGAGGGGSGGLVKIEASVIDGSGSIRANGGYGGTGFGNTCTGVYDCNGGGGGGGRIYINRDSGSFNTDNATVLGGLSQSNPSYCSGQGGSGVKNINIFTPLLPFKTPGTYSSYIDSGVAAGVAWGEFRYTKGGDISTSISFRVMTSAAAAMPGTIATQGCLISAQTVAALHSFDLSSCAQGITNGHRYLWYQATLTAGGAGNSFSPELQDVQATWTDYYEPAGTYTSAVYDTISNQNYGTINWNNTLNSGSISIRARSCNNADCSDGTSFTSCSNLSSGSDITGGCVIDGGRYIQYRATLNRAADPALSPLLNSLTINFAQNPVFTSGDLINVVVSIADASPMSAVNPPKVYIQHPDGTDIATLQLYDDAFHGDNIASNGIYGINPWDSAGQLSGPYYIDVFAEDNKGNSTGIINNLAGFALIGPCQNITSISHNGLTYGTIEALDGRCWLDRNLGSAAVGGHGWYYQWGRGTDGHQIMTSGITTTLSSGTNPGHGNFISPAAFPGDWLSPQSSGLWQGVSGVNNPCPAGFRLPTNNEWNLLINADSAFISSLNLPAAGRRQTNGAMGNVNSSGYYWSSTPFTTQSYFLYYSGPSVIPQGGTRGQGLSVRCIKN